MADDASYMRRALELASRGTGLTFPNPLVGAVVVSGGGIVGEGFHAHAGGPHAEVVALHEAGERARGGTLFCNLEPCCHHGRTPPCTDAISAAGIARVEYAMKDPDERVRGKGAARMRELGIETRGGLLAGEALELNLPYAHRRLTGRPFIMLKLALTLDGRLAGGEGRYLTCEGSRECVHGMRARMEAIAIGSGTLLADDPELDRRLYPAELDPPVRMVFDSRLRFDPGHRWLSRGEPVIVYCGENAQRERIGILREAGAEVVALPAGDGGLDLGDWVGDVGERGITSVLVEGGGALATSMVRQTIPDRMVLFHAPVVGGAGQPSWFRDDGVPPEACASRDAALSLTRVERIGPDVMSVYDRPSVQGYLEQLAGPARGGRGRGAGDPRCEA
jgi:diaminohydroxyphosphoribosylaminopyrimidine deaminase / 5-amino-6-(5-phosphoribosylamino)uracil reductase